MRQQERNHDNGSVNDRAREENNNHDEEDDQKEVFDHEDTSSDAVTDSVITSFAVPGRLAQFFGEGAS
jgi:hypothetical protein